MAYLPRALVLRRPQDKPTASNATSAKPPTSAAPVLPRPPRAASAPEGRLLAPPRLLGGGAVEGPANSEVEVPPEVAEVLGDRADEVPADEVLVGTGPGEAVVGVGGSTLVVGAAVVEGSAPGPVPEERAALATF